MATVPREQLTFRTLVRTGAEADDEADEHGPRGRALCDGRGARIRGVARPQQLQVEHERRRHRQRRQPEADTAAAGAAPRTLWIALPSPYFLQYCSLLQWPADTT